MSFSQISDDHLFCSPDGLIRVIDIPRSIAHSQDLTWKGKALKQIYSTSAPDTPYPSTEPKSDNARLNVLARLDLGTQRRNLEYAGHLRSQLHELNKLYTGLWSATRLTRQVGATKEELNRKSPADLSIPPLTRNQQGVQSLRCLRLDNSDSSKLLVESLRNVFIHNPGPKASLIQATSEEGDEPIYSIPDFSAVCNSSIDKQSAREFVESLRNLYPEDSITLKRGQVDIILMDPPWTNRSVQRSDQYSTLSTHWQDQDPLTAVEAVLPRLLATRGLLAIWITNKSSARQRAMQIFQRLGAEIIQEWIWLKVTTKGEPVYTLDGIYRQSWEVCLVGRRGDTFSNSDSKDAKRLIIACPELHSRKPAIGRMLVEHYDSDKPDGLRKLEIFARYVSAGWCAWGDEALKFNDTDWWVDDQDPKDSSNEESGRHIENLMLL